MRNTVKAKDWATENADGRQQAAAAIADLRASGNVPALVAKVRAMAARSDGEAVGFLYEVSTRLV